MNVSINDLKKRIEFSHQSFCVRMQGHAMMEAGINDNDLLRVKTCHPPKEGDIVMALVDDEVFIRRYFLDQSRVVLMAENVNYPCMVLDEYDLYEICGVVSLRTTNEQFESH